MEGKMSLILSNVCLSIIKRISGSNIKETF